MTNKLNNSATLKLRVLTSKFSDYRKFYEEVKDKYNDDRRVFQNVYEQLLEALEVMGTIENTMIWVAFNEKFNEELKTLDSIIEKFKAL